MGKWFESPAPASLNNCYHHFYQFGNIQKIKIFTRADIFESVNSSFSHVPAQVTIILSKAGFVSTNLAILILPCLFFAVISTGTPTSPCYFYANKTNHCFFYSHKNEIACINLL
jgi:hypothetical protein